MLLSQMERTSAYATSEAQRTTTNTGWDGTLELNSQVVRNHNRADITEEKKKNRKAKLHVTDDLQMPTEHISWQ